LLIARIASAIADFDNLSSAGSLTMIHGVMIRRLIELSSLTVVLLLVTGSSVASDKAPRFLLRAADGVTSTVPTAGPNNFSNCVLVMPDGRFYILLRRQEIMDGTGTAKGFEVR
jgi:hypothetical protein